MSKKKNTKNKVLYNFILKTPRGKFTMAKLMAANPSISYITLKKRVDKMIVDGLLEPQGVVFDSSRRGRSLKLYAKPATPHHEVIHKINPVSGLKPLVLAQ
jgi:hypothetical protein